MSNWVERVLKIDRMELNQNSIPTSICGTPNPVFLDTCLIKRLNFGFKAFAAGPPSFPNSMNLHV
jgi:hypothetical protein